MSVQSDLPDIDKASLGAEAGAYETALSDFKAVFNKLNGEM